MNKVLSLLVIVSTAVMLTGVITYGTAYAQKAECIGTASCLVGKVKRIVDGDTLVVGQKTIRLSLTNTPEKNQSGFKEAKTFTSKMCPVGSTVTVDQDDGQRIDKYKRTLGKVICSGKVLNAELLYSSHAKISKQYCGESEFAGERWAKKYGCAQTVQKKKQENSQSLQAPQPPASSSSPTQTRENNCDPSYPDFCIPSSPPDLDCGDITQRNFKVLPPDPHRFDNDKDGIGCEA